MRTRYQVVLQSNLFADNAKQDKTEKSVKIRQISYYSNESMEPEKNIDEYMRKNNSTFFNEAVLQNQTYKMKI